MLTLSEVFSEKRMRAAMEHLLTKNNSKGPDGMPLHEIQNYWKLNKEAIREMAEHNALPVAAAREMEIIQGNGKRRSIVQMNGLDRLILRSLSQLFQEEWEPYLSPHSFAFRKDRGLHGAVKQLVSYVSQGCEWVAEIDIQNYFDSINQERLLTILRERIEDNALIKLIHHYLRVKLIKEDSAEIKTRGLLQGSPLSPVLGNIYLDSLDKALEEQRALFVRYCDDIYILTSEMKGAAEKLDFAKKTLKEAHDLEAHPTKTGVFPVMSRTLLGYVIRKENGKVLAKKREKGESRVYQTWQASAIQKIDRNYHLLNDGILTRKDYSILFESEEGKRYIPVETTDTLNIYGGVIMSGDFLRFIGDKRMQLNVYDRYGRLSGRYMGGGIQSQVKTMMKQVQCYNDEEARLRLAKSIIMAAVHNMRANVRYYKKRKQNDILLSVEKAMNVIIKDMNESSLLILVNERLAK